ncbi:dihydrofolate reductase family protein [Streptosporangium sp. NPDC051023]|uniref:dihydrofolate reductase family protein n=1 Tax=Streptosporangium sp. NPDC051023 TaxID=3155410 RepID=UPI00345039BF
MVDLDGDDRGRPEGKVLWHVTMSLDGFISGPGGAMDWVFEHPSEPSAAAEETIRTTGAVLAGRRWYDEAKSIHGGLEGIYGGAWSGPVFVLTHRPSPARDEEPAVTFLSGDVRDAVAAALHAAGGKNVVMFGADVTRQCVEEGLVDEILIHLVPVLLGDGVRLFGGPGGRRTSLEKIGRGRPRQLTDLRFRVLKDTAS